MPDNTTFDNKQTIKPIGIEDIDKAFFNWWDSFVNLEIIKTGDTKKKVPVLFVAPERWHIARQQGIRDENGSLVLPIIALSRTKMGGTTEAPFQRTVADIKKDKVYFRQISSKSSLIKELLQNRPFNIDPNLPIYEIFTTKVPDFSNLTYEVKIWAGYIGEMNKMLEKIGQSYNSLSIKNFVFSDECGFRFRAFQNEELTDESNFDDYSDDERIIKKTLIFNVPAYFFPKTEGGNQFKRYLSQTKVVIKEIIE